MDRENKISTPPKIWLILLRIGIGWHFLYEGLAKVVNPAWSSAGYLHDSKGPFSSVFHAMAANSGYNIFSEGLQNEQLFDLYRDPGETQNLSNEPTLKNLKNRLRGYLHDWMEKTNDDF